MWVELKNFVLAFYILARRIVSLVANLFVSIYKFLLPLRDSVRGVINQEEFYRIIMLALSTGGTFRGFVDYMRGHYQDFITDPILLIGVKAFLEHCYEKHLPVVFCIVLFAGDYMRRKYLHGSVSQ